jgi:hypothetical protein
VKAFDFNLKQFFFLLRLKENVARSKVSALTDDRSQIVMVSMVVNSYVLDVRLE